MTWPTPLEWLAVAFILANVWLAIKVNIWCWPVGIAGVILYGIVFWQGHLYANAALQLVYLVLSIHGWYEWLHGGLNKTQPPIRLASARVMIICAVATAALTAPIMWLLLRMQNPAFPFWDAFTVAISLVGQWLMNEKYLENWIYWIVVDVMYVPLFIAEKLPASAPLYAILTFLAWRGYVDWKRTAAAEAAIAVAA